MSTMFFFRYAIPLVQKILSAKQLAESAHSAEGECVQALVLVPSKELSQQSAANLRVGVTPPCCRARCIVSL